MSIGQSDLQHGAWRGNTQWYKQAMALTGRLTKLRREAANAGWLYGRQAEQRLEAIKAEIASVTEELQQYAHEYGCNIVWPTHREEE